MSYKIILTKPTKDATTETNPDNMVFSSDYNTLKYYLSGSQDIAITGDGTDKSTEVTITHDLGYIPVFMVYVNNIFDDSGYYLVPFAYNPLGTIREASAWADTTKLYLKFRNKSPTTYTAHFYYKIFKNSLGI